MNYRHIKTDYLEMVSGASREVVIELIDIFRKQVEEFYNEMKSLCQSGNLTELGMLAHKAKSSVAIMGMDKMAERLKEIEIRTKNGDYSTDFSVTIEDFRTETAEAILELEHYSQTI